ncbi:MAG: hypothetical protein KC621_33665 [Myxococcales bacterium]|nr:hypothetical protein [Myxococcales bacterium]
MPTDALVVDDVGMSRAQADAMVRFVNTATPDQLAAAGVYDRGVGVILQNRPFASAEAFAATSGIGTKTVQACLRASE